MYKKIVTALMSVMMLLGLVSGTQLMTNNAWAISTECPAGTERAGETVSNLGQCNVPKNEEKDGQERDVFYYVNVGINIVIGIGAMVAIVMIIISAIGITTAGGDPSKVKKGTSGIIFAIVGLVVALLAYAIVNFVLSAVFE